MNRMLIAFVLSLASMCVAASGDTITALKCTVGGDCVTVTVPRPLFVDLDSPGALDMLKLSNPEHYPRVAGVLNASYDMSCDVPAFDTLIQTKFAARKAACGPLIKTSLPAKRQLSFLIDRTIYSKTVYFKSTEKLHPAEESWIPAR